MDSPVQKIKERLTIEEIVSSYIKLERSGANLKAKCPFHNEKTASFFVSPARGSFYCFGCSAGGDIFSFVQEFEGLDFRGALKMLAERAGVPLTQYDSHTERENASEKEKLYKVLEEATKFFENNLSHNKDAISYLISRGLEEETIKNFRLGYAKGEWRSLFTHLKDKKFSEAEMEKAGLIKRGEKESSPTTVSFYDRFRGRIMFPISDSSGRIIAFSGRIFEAALSKEEVEKSAKYINSPETPIFSKSSVLYGIDRAKESIRKNNFSILVEGQMDLILSHQAGFRNTIASSGTALSDETVSKENIVSNLGLVRRLSPNIVLAFDADSAGLKAALRAGRIALSFGMDVKVAKLQEGIDPADLIATKGKEAWRRAVRNSKHLIEFLLSQVLTVSKDDSRKVGREIKEKILPFVASLESTIEKNHFLKLISDQSGIAMVALEGDLKKVEADLNSEKREMEASVIEENKIFRKDHIQQKLLGIILWQKAEKNPKIDVDKLVEEMAGICEISPERLISRQSEDREELIFEAEVFYQDDADLDKDVGELLGNLKEEYLKEELENKLRSLRRAEEDKDPKLSSELLKECQDLSAKIQNIKNSRSK